MISRRNFLASASIPLIFSEFSCSTKEFSLVAEPVSVKVQPEKDEIPLWGFNGSTPGPIIRAKKGERLKIRFDNVLQEATAVHWHGIRIDNKMDGVPNLTQKIVEQGKSHSYDFIVPDAGTYWYHSHSRSWEQVARGLYGALIVAEDNPPQVDHDMIVMVDDWRLNEDGTQAAGFENMHDRSHAGRLGNFARVDFYGNNTVVKKGERLRLRFINVATDLVFELALSGLAGKVVAYDGMPLKIVEDIQDVIILAPAQRIDIIADVIEDEISVDFPRRDGEPYHLGTLKTEGEVRLGSDKNIEPLEANHYQEPNLKNAIELTLKMEGGAMTPMMREGMQDGNFWAFNGISGMQPEPFHTFNKGQSGVIELINETRFAHAIHLHGHHFQLIKSSGALSPLRDTILIEPMERQKIACVFDNEGKWLLHCHMLAHQASGMKTWVEVRS